MRVRDCIFFQLTKASLAGTAFRGKKVEHLGITAPQAVTLNFLGEKDRILSRELREKLQITSATKTGILDRLEKLCLIKRQPHPHDRRAILVRLTEKGARYAKEIKAIMISANEEFLAAFRAEEAKSFRNMLNQLQEDTHSQDAL